MKFSVMMSKVGAGWLAQCEEVDRAGEGSTPAEALASLRESLEDYFGQAEAVAPPAQPTREPIELVVIDGPPDVTR